MARFKFSPSPFEEQLGFLNKKGAASVDMERVIGRDGDKEGILQFLRDGKSHPGETVRSIAIVGIGGIGKTALAQLVYRDEEVKRIFEKRCWASISSMYDEKEILGRIFESISRNESFHGASISKLFSAIMDSMNSSGKYLLVLDDVMDCSSSIWLKVMSLLRSGAVGSRIIITSRDLTVAKDIGADEIHQLQGLRDEDAWNLFKRIAFQPEQRCAPDQEACGKEIVRRCYGVPLAIKSMASLCSAKTSLEEWKAFTNDNVLFTRRAWLELSYNQLPVTLKQCLDYCCLFPRDYIIQKKEIVHLWIAQGFVMPASDDRLVEEIGYGYCKELSERFFFQQATLDDCGEVLEVLSYKIPSVIYDLLLRVAGDESIMITKQSIPSFNRIRHVSVGHEVDSSWNILQSLLHKGGPLLRSFLFLYKGSLSPLVLHDLLTKFKRLRALNLGHQNIEVVPSSIGNLIHLRYLNLSNNKFTCLPNSITKLSNLVTLNISRCEQLELLPNEFSKLRSLRHLDAKKCYRLRYMPPGFEKLTSLQCLSFFKVGNVRNASHSKLNVLADLDLKGELEIKFDKHMSWNEIEGMQLSNGIRVLILENYPGKILPNWETTAPSLLSNLVSLHIVSSSNIEHLSLCRGLDSLKSLQLSDLEQLEYIETEKDKIECIRSIVSFPSLKFLKLEGLPALKGWSRDVVKGWSRDVEGAFTRLPVLADLTVSCCPELKFMPLSPCLKTLELNDVNHRLIQHLLCATTAPSSPFESIAIWGCDIPIFPGEDLTCLRQLQVRFCDRLQYLNLASLEQNTLEELVIQSCPELDLWDEKKRGVDWDSLTKLRKLTLIGMPHQVRLPGCLQKLQEQGNLLINIKSPFLAVSSSFKEKAISNTTDFQMISRNNEDSSSADLSHQSKQKHITSAPRSVSVQSDSASLAALSINSKSRIGWPFTSCIYKKPKSIMIQIIRRNC